jgi:hypothetical protein
MKVPMQPSVTQIAKSEIKGGCSSGVALGSGMGGMGGFSSLSMLGGMSGPMLRFAPLAAGPGMIFAGPAMSLAAGLLSGGLTHQSNTPTATYLRALPGAHSSFIASGAKPKFEIEFGDLVGLNPDDYEPVLVKLTQTTDNFRLVGATKEKIDSHGRDTRPPSPRPHRHHHHHPGAWTRHHRAAEPLAPGQYGVVLHPIKGKSTSTSPSSGLSI